MPARLLLVLPLEQLLPPRQRDHPLSVAIFLPPNRASLPPARRPLAGPRYLADPPRPPQASHISPRKRGNMHPARVECHARAGAPLLPGGRRAAGRPDAHLDGLDAALEARDARAQVLHVAAERSDLVAQAVDVGA